MPKGTNVTGDYLPDYGGIYGSTKKPFGWSKDISSRTKYYRGQCTDTPMLETSIHFPPSQNSRYCIADKKDPACGNAEWSVKPGKGKFIVKLYFGDPTANSKIDLSINGKEAFSGLVKKGKLMKIEKKVESRDDYITISSKCNTNCGFSMAKLSQVEIMPFIEHAPAPPRATHPTEEKCGGTFIKGNIKSILTYN